MSQQETIQKLIEGQGWKFWWSKRTLFPFLRIEIRKTSIARERTWKRMYSSLLSVSVKTRLSMITSSIAKQTVKQSPLTQVRLHVETVKETRWKFNVTRWYVRGAVTKLPDNFLRWRTYLALTGSMPVQNNSPGGYEDSLAHNIHVARFTCRSWHDLCPEGIGQASFHEGSLHILCRRFVVADTALSQAYFPFSELQLRLVSVGSFVARR